MEEIFWVTERVKSNWKHACQWARPFLSKFLISVRKQNGTEYEPLPANLSTLLSCCHIIKILLTELGRSLWENLHLGCWYKPHCVRSVLATSVKILPYRPPARLVRTVILSHTQISRYLRLYLNSSSKNNGYLFLNACCNIRNVKSNYLKCIVSQCLWSPCVLSSISEEQTRVSKTHNDEQ